MAEPFLCKTEMPNSITMRDSEKNAIQTAIESTRGNLSKAAKLLKIGRTTLYRKMQEFGLSA